MRVLVTGGAGYIGSHTAALLAGRGDFVVVLDSLEHGYRQAVGPLPLVVGSTHDAALVRQVIGDHRLEAIIHFAAYKAAGESMAHPGKYFENNVGGSLRLLEAACSAGVRRFVFSSTAAVYGTPRSLPVQEDADLRPENPYGESKLIVERMLRWFDACHGLRSVALRYFNAAGAAESGDNGEDPRHVANLIPLVMKVATGRAPRLQIFGTDYPTPDGSGIRDYIHVLDLAEAHARALDFLAAGHPSDVFNVGTGQGASVLEVLEAARRVSGAPIPADVVARRPGDPPAVYADNRKAREILGWSPRYGLNEIIATAWQWHHKHPDGFAGA
jgi:UDP-glucose-4-epimerase GalE